MISFAAGTLMGGAFLHLIPVSLPPNGGHSNSFIWLLAGFSLFFLIELILHSHTNHYPEKQYKKPVSYMILIADGLHNFIDGVAIGSSFLISKEAGIITVIIAAMHEIPHELSDFGILLYGGWKIRNALFANFISALTIIPGGIVAYLFSGLIDISFLLPFAAGNFLYIAASDLIPEIKVNENRLKSFILFSVFLSGIFFIFILRFFDH